MSKNGLQKRSNINMSSPDVDNFFVAKEPEYKHVQSGCRQLVPGVLKFLCISSGYLP